MKCLRATLLSMIAILVVVTVASPAYAGVSFNLFYSNLSPHGTWLVSAEYGRVWQPWDSYRGWNPYLDGHWVYADVGWTWVSDYEWGDLPYHYGTWFNDPNYGWVWVPGYVWAPAWVVFRTGPDYIGWAPVSPGFSINASWSQGAPGGPFLFVSTSHFCDPRVGRYVVSEHTNGRILNETRVVHNLTVEQNVVVNRGPDPRMIERASGRRVRAVPIESIPRVVPGGGGARSAITVDPHRMTHDLRATQPAAAGRPQAPGHAHGNEAGAPSAPHVSTPTPGPSVHSSHQSDRPAPNPTDTSQSPHGKPKGHGKPHPSGKPHSS